MRNFSECTLIIIFLSAHTWYLQFDPLLCNREIIIRYTICIFSAVKELGLCSEFSIHQKTGKDKEMYGTNGVLHYD